MVWVQCSKMKELGFLNDLISVFEKLPGVGKKTATRYAYYIIEKYDIDDINKVCETLINSFNSIFLPFIF